jgi:hypothetical protein
MNPSRMTHKRSHAGEIGRTKIPSTSGVFLLALFAVILLLYLLLLTKNYYWDGIFFAQTIEDSSRLNAALLHPNHLFYNVVGYFGYRVAHAFGLQLRAVTVLQVLNCFVSAAAACVLFRLLREVFRSAYVSAVLTAVFAFSATWWKFSTDADSYILSVFFLIICFYLILPGREPRPLALAFSHILAMFFHQLSVFFFPVAVLGLVLQSREDKQEIRRVVTYIATVILITVAIFYYSFYLTTGSFALRPFIRWITTFSPEHGFTFHPWGNFVYSLRSQWRVFLGGRVAAVRDFWAPTIVALTSILAGFALVFFYKLLRHFREIKSDLLTSLSKRTPYYKLRMLCCWWIAVYVVFLFFFIPQNTFYRLFYLPPLIVLAGTVLAPIESAEHHVRRHRAALFAAVIFIANLTFSAFPYAQVRANPPLGLALRMNGVWHPGTIVYFGSPNSDNGLVRYFNPSTVWIEATPEVITTQIANLPERGRSAWLDTTLVDRFQATPDGQLWLNFHTIRRAEYELVNKKYRLQFLQLKPESFTNNSSPR